VDNIFSSHYYTFTVTCFWRDIIGENHEDTPRV
jgi:hypothetical protein